MGEQRPVGENEILHVQMNRMEKKIDKLSDALVTLARTEEKVANVVSENDRLFRALQTALKRISILELKATKSGGVINVIERTFWVAFAAGVAFFVGK